MSVHILRAFFIRQILDSRFSVSALEQWKCNDPGWWSSDSNEMGRGFYEEAMRERERLEAATEGELQAELAAVALWWGRSFSQPPAAGEPAP